MKKVLLIVVTIMLTCVVVNGQILYGNKYFDKAGNVFSFTNEPYHSSPWDFDCSCNNSCAKEWWKFYKPDAGSPAGLHTQSIVTQFGQISLFQVDASQSVAGTYPWHHIGRKFVQSSFFCSSCECWVDPISGSNFNIVIADFTWSNLVSNLAYICKSSATPIDLKTYLNYYDNAVTITGPGVNASGILNVSSLAPGTYTVTAQRGFDNMTSPKQITFSFTVVDFTPVISASTLTVCQGTALPLQATPAGDTYQWYLNGVLISGATQQTYNVTATGNYTVAITQNGCTKTSPSVTATVNPSPSVSTAPSGNVLLCTGANLTITSSPATSYVWNTGATSNSIIVNSPGSYFVTVTNSFGCSATSPTVNVSDAGSGTASITVTGSPDLCEGQTVLLTASSGDSYKWYKNGSLLPDVTQSITVNTPGNYNVVVTVGSCTSSSSNVTVTLKTAPLPSISSNQPSTVCEGTVVSLTSSSAASYLWNTGATGNVINPTASGPYNVTVTYSNGCQRQSADYNLTFLPNPQPVITPGGSLTFCQGGSVALNSSVSNSYQWYLNNIIISGATSQTYVATQSGSYTVKAKTASNCERYSDPIVVIVNPKPNVVITTSGISCNNSPVTLTASTVPAISNATYLWSNGSTNNSITVTSTGIYTCSITDQNGCSNTGSYNLTSTSLQAPVISPSGSTTFCSGGVVTLTSSYTTGNVWSTGETSPSIQVSSAGVYTVTVSNGICSATSQSVTVTIHPLPDATISVSGPSEWCEGGTGSVLSANLENAYLWSNGATTRSITPTASGTYTVTTTNVYGCSATSAGVQITIKPNPVPTVSVSGPTTFCNGDSVILTASVGTAFLWSNGATTQTLVAKTAGDYSVTVTGANGCSNTSVPVHVTVYPAVVPVITPSGSTTFCSGGTVVLNSSSANSYQWYLNGVLISGATFQNYTATQTGVYTVKTTSSNGCVNTSAPESVTVNQRPNVVVSNLTGLSCNNSPVTLSASAVPAVNTPTYLWSNGATSQTITVTATGMYNCTITDINGCSNTGTYNLNSTTLQAPVITPSGSTSFCSGGLITLTSSYATGNTWSTGETSPSIQVSTAGVYTVTVSNGICSATSQSVTINIYPVPEATITVTGNTEWCQGQTPATLTSNVEANYLWSNGATTRSIFPTSTGFYTVKTTNVYGCSTTSSPVYINVKSNPVPTVSIIGQTTFCSGDSAILTASTGTAFLWSNGATSQSITVRSSGDYSVTVTGINGCQNTSPVIHIIVLPPVQSSVTAAGPTTFCEGGSVDLTASPGDAYLWNDGRTTRTITVNQSGNYWVAVFKNGCNATSAIVQVTVMAKPVVSIAGGGTLGCSGVPVTLTGFTPTPNVTYLWSNGATTQSIAVTTPGPFTVTAFDQFGCAGTSAPVTLQFTSIPPPTITASGPTIFCPGDSVILTSSTANTYQWSTNETTRSIVVKTAGSYTVTVFNSNGCSATSQIINVSIHANETPTVEIVGSSTICNGDSVVLRSSPASGYQWFPNGGNTQEIVVRTAGTYYVQTTSQYGCINTSAPVSITVKPVVKPTISTPNGTIGCDGDTIRLISSPGVSYSWSTGEITQTAFITTTGRYAVTTQNANGCFGHSDSVYVLFRDNPKPIVTPSRALYICDTPALYLTSSLAVAYLWNTGATTQTIKPTNTGNYWVQATNPNGCKAKSDIIQVQQGITVALNPISAKQFCVDAGTITMTYGNPTGGYYTGPGVQNLNEFVPSVAGVGTHTIAYNYVSTTGCLTYVNFTVTVKPKIVWHANADTSICLGGGIYDLYNVSMPIGLTSYAGPGVTGRFFNPAVAGVGTFQVSITVDDGIGCTETKIMNITVFDNPSKPVIVGPLSGCKGDVITVAASSINANSYKWYYLGNPVPFATTQQVNITLAANKKIYVKAYFISTAGAEACISPSSDTLDILLKNPTGDFRSDFTTIPWGGLVKFNTNIVNGNSYYWTFGDGAGSYSAQQNPGHYYYQPGQHTVYLKVTSPEGCILEITKLLYITVGEKPKDTTATILPITATDDKNPYKINLFPNPYDTRLFVTFSLPAASDKITVTAYTQKGEILAEEKISGVKGNNKIQLKNFNNLSTQVYYVFKVQVLNSILNFKQVRIKQ